MRYQVYVNGTPWTGYIDDQMNALRSAWWLWRRYGDSPRLDINVMEIDNKGRKCLLTNPKEPHEIRFRPTHLINNPNWRNRNGLP